MARFLLLSLLLCACALPAFAQERLTEDELEGTQWQLVIDIPVEEGETAIERIALKAVAGLVDEFDVMFRFRRDGELLVLTDVMGDKDGEESTWSIDDDGVLILGDNDRIDVEVDGWMRDGERIFGYEKNGNGWDRKEGVYLKPLY
ncbi:MAG: hypothetical protein AAF730_01310 [Bacteroidota bacterium]